MKKVFNIKIGKPIGNLYRKNHVLVLIQLDNGNFIMGKKLGFYPEHIARFVGGGVKENESSLEAVRREVEEELKIEVDKGKFVHLIEVTTNAVTEEGKMFMKTNVYSIILDKDTKLIASDDLTGIEEFTYDQLNQLILDMQSLSGTFITEKFTFDWKDWGMIYGPIHEFSMKEFIKLQLFLKNT